MIRTFATSASRLDAFIIVRLHERIGHAIPRAVPGDPGLSSDGDTLTGGPVCPESRAAALRLHTPGHRHGQADLSVELPWQEGAAHPFCFVVSGLPQAR